MINSSPNKIKVGTRASRLALAQVSEVTKLLSSHISPSEIEIIPITTSGDKIQDRSLCDIGGKGLFVKELEEALLQKRIDIAIHSAKDVPPLINEQTNLAAFTHRLDARDCLISDKFDAIENLPFGAVVGTSSARRKAILLRLRPDLKITPFRGNVDTRLGKIAKNEVDASILAVAGLERLSAKNSIKKIIEKNVMLPAGGQGSLALQIRNDDEKIAGLLAKISDKEATICIKTERAFLSELGASCITPVAVHAWLENGNLNLKTIILDYDGSEIFETVSSSKFTLKEGINLGVSAAQKTKKEAKKLLQKIIS